MTEEDEERNLVEEEKAKRELSALTNHKFYLQRYAVIASQQ